MEVFTTFFVILLAGMALPIVFLLSRRALRSLLRDFRSGRDDGESEAEASDVWSRRPIRSTGDWLGGLVAAAESGE